MHFDFYDYEEFILWEMTSIIKYQNKCAPIRTTVDYFLTTMYSIIVFCLDFTCLVHQYIFPKMHSNLSFAMHRFIFKENGTDQIAFKHIEPIRRKGKPVKNL